MRFLFNRPTRVYTQLFLSCAAGYHYRCRGTAFVGQVREASAEHDLAECLCACHRPPAEAEAAAEGDAAA